MRLWVDKKSKMEGRPWSTLPNFTKDEVEMIKGESGAQSLKYIAI